MMNQRAVRGWHQMLTNQGFAATFRVARARVAHRLARQFWPRGRDSAHVETDVPAIDLASQNVLHPAIHPFDQRYGVETSGLIWGEHLASGSPNDRWSTAYYGIAPSVFHAMLAQVRDSIPGAAFIDMGSGKGRAVMLASQFPFADVFGVELSPELHAVATANLAAFQAKAPAATRVHLHRGDAAEFEFPLQPLVLFLYHPFCKPVLQTVLMSLEQSLREHPRPAHILYINIELRGVLDRAPFLTRTFSETLAMSAEDQMADRVGSTVEECAIYTSNIS